MVSETVSEKDTPPDAQLLALAYAYRGLDPEPVSEKRPRGRPKAWHAPMGLHDGLGATTERGKQNRRLALRAQFVLDHNWEPAFAWFWGSAPVPSFEDILKGPLHLDPIFQRCTRRTVLTELGRIRHHEDLLEAARQVAAWPLEMRTRTAATRIREWRTGRKGNAKALMGKVARLVDQYVGEHTEISYDDARAAMNDLLDRTEHLSEQPATEPEEERFRVDVEPVRVEEPTEPVEDMEHVEPLRMRVG
jgi:polyhydroxyalkanoate synthesis regulator phasin